jgi:glycerophosphoryl diester phosphodiesterase
MEFSLKQKLGITTMIVLMIAGGCKLRHSVAPWPKFDTEGHRGARGLMPENTIPAMLKAIDLGVTTLEMDAHITSDNQVILSHDDHLNPLFTLTADGKELSKEVAEQSVFYQMDYATISKFDVGSKFYDKFPGQQKLKAHIPLLSKLIDSVQNYLADKGSSQVFYNIETKSKPEGDNKLHPEPEVFVKLLMDVIESKKIMPWVIIQSFDARTLQVLHKLYPNVRTSFLVESDSFEKNLQKLTFIPTIYSPTAKLVTADLAREVHAKGVKIVPWTVNTNGVISDYPDLF